jgi:hypothetical protein
MWPLDHCFGSSHNDTDANFPELMTKKLGQGILDVFVARNRITGGSGSLIR